MVGPLRISVAPSNSRLARSTSFLGTCAKPAPRESFSTRWFGRALMHRLSDEALREAGARSRSTQRGGS
eukprot:5518521-Pyramimonas_sp.AAC.1